MNFTDMYVGKAFLDAGCDKTHVVRVVQYDERGRAEITKRRRACALNREGIIRGRCRLHR